MTEEYSNRGLTNVQKSSGENDRVARSKSMQDQFDTQYSLRTILSTCFENFIMLQYVTPIPISVTESTNTIGILSDIDVTQTS